MSFKHKPILPKVEDCNFQYSSATNSSATNDWELDGYCDGDNTPDEIFYLGFDDVVSADDKEGFLLMCSENELVQLVNHLRMIRGI